MVFPPVGVVFPPVGVVLLLPMELLLEDLVGLSL